MVSKLGGEASALGAARLIAKRIIKDLYFHWPLHDSTPAHIGEEMKGPGDEVRLLGSESGGSGGSDFEGKPSLRIKDAVRDCSPAGEVQFT